MKIKVCTWKSCKSKFSEYIFDRIERDIVKFNLENISVEKCSCLMDCGMWPNVLIDGKKENFSDPIKISKIIFDKIKQRKWIQKEDTQDYFNNN